MRTNKSLRCERVMREHNNSERKSAGSAATAIQSHARKSVENNCVVSLSFGIFSFSLFLQQKRKKSTTKLSLHFFFFKKQKKKKRSKKEETLLLAMLLRA